MRDLTPAAALTLFKFGYNSFEIAQKRDMQERDVCRLLHQARIDVRAAIKKRMKRKATQHLRRPA